MVNGSIAIGANKPQVILNSINSPAAGKARQEEYPAYISAFDRKGNSEKIRSIAGEAGLTGAKEVKVKVAGGVSNTLKDSGSTKRRNVISSRENSIKSKSGKFTRYSFQFFHVCNFA